MRYIDKFFNRLCIILLVLGFTILLPFVILITLIKDMYYELLDYPWYKVKSFYIASYQELKK